MYEVDIIQLDNNFNFIKNIKSSKADITKNEWKLYDSMIISENNKITEFNIINFNTNFNFEEINKLFSNLSSLTFWKLNALKNNYKKINYSTTEIDHHIQKIISYPFLITIITLLSCIVMLNIQYQKPKLFIVVIGILLSVSIYYFNFFFGALGKNERIPLFVATWMPILILFIFSLIGLIRINEK